MFIKVLYLIFIFLSVRLIFRSLNKYNQMVGRNKHQKKNNDDDIIDAEYTVVEENESR